MTCDRFKQHSLIPLSLRSLADEHEVDVIGINIGSHIDCGSSSSNSSNASDVIIGGSGTADRSAASAAANSGVAIAASWTRQLTIGGGGHGHDGVSGTIQVQSA